MPRVLGVLGIEWRAMLVALPLGIVAAGFVVGQAVLSAARAHFTTRPLRRSTRARLFALTTFLHVMQPCARLVGRLQHGLAPWRRRGPRQRLWHTRHTASVWCETWKAPSVWLDALQTALVAAGAVTACGGEYDDWDLEARGGLHGGARLRMAVEEHGAGKQMLRFRSWMRPAPMVLVLAVVRRDSVQLHSHRVPW